MANEECEEPTEADGVEKLKIERPPRAKLSREEALRRMEDFPKRRDKFIAAVRKGKG